MSTKKIIAPPPTLKAPGMQTILSAGDAKLLLYPNFITPPQLVAYTPLALDLPLMERPAIVLWGKPMRMSRNVGFFAQPHVPGYKYSGQQTPVTDIADFPFLQTIMDQVNDTLQADFNGILVNRYDNGSSYIGAHSDDESSLSPQGVASIAFGATRNFRIRHKHNRQIVIDLPHQPGSLLVMTGSFQQKFLHERDTIKCVRLRRTILCVPLGSLIDLLRKSHLTDYTDEVRIISCVMVNV